MKPPYRQQQHLGAVLACLSMLLATVYLMSYFSEVALTDKKAERFEFPETITEEVVLARPQLGEPVPLDSDDPVELLERGQEPIGYAYSQSTWQTKFRASRAKLLKSHPLCEGCGCSDECSPLNAHHVVSVKKIHDEKLDESLLWDESNLVALCRPCHSRLGHPDGWQSSNPRVREDAARNFFRTHPGWTYEEKVAEFEFSKPLAIEFVMERNSEQPKRTVAP